MVDYVDSQDATIRITINPRGQSWTSIGRQILKVKPPDPTMNLDIDDTEDISEKDKTTILREFGYTLGLVHEDQPPIQIGCNPGCDYQKSLGGDNIKLMPAQARFTRSLEKE